MRGVKRAQEAATRSTLGVPLGLLTDEVPQGGGATHRLLHHHRAGRALAVVGARIHPPGQNAPQRGDVSRGGRGVHGGGPTTKRRRAGEVAEAVAALGHRAHLSGAGSREGGAGAGVRRWCPGLDRREEDEDVGRRSREEGLRQKDQPPLGPPRLDAGPRPLTAAGELTLKTKH